MTSDSPELSGAWPQDELLVPAIRAPRGVDPRHLEALIGEDLMQGQVAVLKLGQIARDQLGDEAEPIIADAMVFIDAATDDLRGRGYSGLEIGAVLAAATQPPEQDPSGQRFRRIRQLGRRLISLE